MYAKNLLEVVSIPPIGPNSCAGAKGRHSGLPLHLIEGFEKRL